MGIADKNPPIGNGNRVRVRRHPRKLPSTKKAIEPTSGKKEHRILDTCPLCNKPVYKRVKHKFFTTSPEWKHDEKTKRYYHKSCWKQEDKSRVGRSRIKGGIKLVDKVEGYIEKEDL